MLIRLALKSLWSRRLTAALTALTIALSVMLLLGVEKVRTGARESFAGAISGVDLIMGARAGEVQLLLYSVFHIGAATNNVTWESYEDVRALPGVAWMVPISLGDSHRGYRVMGTTAEMFERYQYRGGQALRFAQGGPFADLFDAVIGAEVAQKLGYALGDEIIVAHGLESFIDHADKPFRVAGVLEPSGTPMDRVVMVSLEAIEAIHVDWRSGARDTANAVSAEQVRGMDLSPRAVTAALIGVERRLQVFQLQRAINEYRQEPLLAALPGVSLQQLWSLLGGAEQALLAVSAMVAVAALLGLIATIFAGLNERRREMAILRAVGARPATIAGLLILEAALLTLFGAILGAAALYLALWLARPVIDSLYGLWLPLNPPGAREALILAAVAGAGVLASLAPAIRAYRLSLADGMSVRS